MTTDQLFPEINYPERYTENSPVVSYYKKSIKPSCLSLLIQFSMYLAAYSIITL